MIVAAGFNGYLLARSEYGQITFISQYTFTIDNISLDTNNLPSTGQIGLNGSLFTSVLGHDGKIYLGGMIRSDKMINLVGAAGADIIIDVAAYIETLHDSIVIDTGNIGWVRGELIAGGKGSDVSLTINSEVQNQNPAPAPAVTITPSAPETPAAPALCSLETC